MQRVFNCFYAPILLLLVACRSTTYFFSPATSIMAEQLSSLLLFFAELRKSVKLLAITLAVTTAVCFTFSGELIGLIEGYLHQNLHFFSVAGPFLAHVKVAFFAALYVVMPLCMHILWKAMGKPFSVEGARLFWFVAATCVLFYGGTVFCFLLTLPFGINFLLSFQSQDLQAVISITRFVNFVTLFLLAFGVIFELPVFMVFSAQVGLISRRAFERNRRYAVLIIAILAALLTPTPDIVNMALMGGPLYLLYESGILIIRVFGLDAPNGEIKVAEGGNQTSSDSR